MGRFAQQCFGLFRTLVVLRKTLFVSIVRIEYFLSCYLKNSPCPLVLMYYGCILFQVSAKYESDAFSQWQPPVFCTSFIEIVHPRQEGQQCDNCFRWHICFDWIHALRRIGNISPIVDDDLYDNIIKQALMNIEFRKLTECACLRGETLQIRNAN
jgi:hypothetical protein